MTPHCAVIPEAMVASLFSLESAQPPPTEERLYQGHCYPPADTLPDAEAEALTETLMLAEAEA